MIQARRRASILSLWTNPLSTVMIAVIPKTCSNN